jgi:uncharacterized protein with von Willebrand factor type A (vWA) domain
MANRSGPDERDGPAEPNGSADRSRLSDRSGLVELLVTFGGELRAAGLPVGTGDVQTFCAAAAELDPTELTDLYWAGRASLVTRRDHIGVYDRAFRRYFLAEAQADPEPLRRLLASRAERGGVLQIPDPEPVGDERQDRQANLGLVAADAEVLRHKMFNACTAEELAVVRRIMGRIRLTPPRRRTRRADPASDGGRPDMRRIARQTMRMHGDPSALYWRRRRLRVRPLILILDVSGSMADYSRALLQFAYSARRAADRVEVFCFGTRLTRITRELDRRRPDEAMRRAAASVLDWDGGTRIGDALDTFVRRWGRRGLCRGGIVVVCSDGLDRGDPRVLAGAMERLALLCHRVVWLNPHLAPTGEPRPSSLGMLVAAPHIDLVLSGHNLAALEEFAALLPTLD